jgi:hypothetical protein
MLDLDTIFDPDREVPRVAQTRPALDDLPLEWHEAWDERAALREYDGGLPREVAEARALQDVLEQMREAAGRPAPNVT